MFMKKLINYIAQQVWNEVGVSLKEGITTEESLKATFKVVSELAGEEFAEQLLINLLEADEETKDDSEDSADTEPQDDFDSEDQESMMTQAERDALNEASFLDPKYKPGHQIIVAAPPPFAKKLKKGDVLTIVTDKAGDPDYGDGEYEKTLQFPDGTEFKIASKNAGYASSYFTHLKSGKAMPSGEDWESLIIVAYNNTFEGYEWERAEKFWADYGNDAKTIAESFRKKIKSKSLSQLGASTAALN
jgi:hypothetical protein